MSNCILTVSKLTKHFPINSGFFSRDKGFIHAVTNASFELFEGETLGIVGESGCGKSTLGRAILRLIEANSGQVLFEDNDISKFSNQKLQNYRQNAQMIFQDPYASLNPRMTIKEILEEPFEIHGILKEKDKRAHELSLLLKDVGLREDVLDKYPHEFSGGQRQRIGIARALALKPKLIICDEPVSALDVSIQSQILNLLKDLREKYKMSLIFISHDLSVVKYISDRVAVMYLGSIIEIGAVDKLFSSPKHPYTKALISSIPKYSKGKKRFKASIEGDLPNPASPPKGCYFHTRCPYVKDICKEKRPELEETSHGQKAACHFKDSLNL